MLLTTNQAQFIVRTLNNAAWVSARVCGSFVFGSGRDAVAVVVDTNCVALPLYVSRDGTLEDYADITAFRTAYSI